MRRHDLAPGASASAASTVSVSIAAAVAVAGVLIVTAFGVLAAPGRAVTAADFHAVVSLNQLHTGVIGALTTIVYTALSPVPAVAMTAVATAVIWLVSRRLPLALTFAIGIAITWLPSALVKAIVHRPRPDAQLLPHPLASQPSDASYPSGHEAFVAAVVVVVLLMVRGTTARAVVGVVGALAIIAVGFSLVTDGVHYPTDVAASVLWALTLAPVIVLLVRRFVVPPLERRLPGRRRAVS